MSGRTGAISGWCARWRTLMGVGLALWLLGCTATEDRSPRALARVATHRDHLIGGPRALGEPGDFLLENDRIRILIQAPGDSRGFGVYGGSILDAVQVGPDAPGDQMRGPGNDAFGELFPAFFLQAMAVDEVVILDDGRDGGPARIAARGSAGDFLEIVGVLNRAALGSHSDYLDASSSQRVQYEQVYELRPGEDWVRLTFTLRNTGDVPLVLPGPDAVQLLRVLGLSLDGFTVPIGDVALYGSLSQVFLPGEGFDVRFGLERAYASGVEWPAFPGIVVDWVASRGDGVSYGLLAEADERNYVWQKREVYDTVDAPVTRSSMLVPFIASGFLGVFHGEAPGRIEPGEAFSVSRYFVVGSGDVGSVLDSVYRIRERDDLGTVGGQVFDALSRQPVEGLSVVLSRVAADGVLRPLTQYTTRRQGSFRGTLEPGRYVAHVQGEGRFLSEPVEVEVRTGAHTALTLLAPSPGRVAVRVFDEEGRALPAKITAVGTADAAFSGLDPATFLYNLRLGESFLTTDLVPDDPDDPTTRRWIEGVAFTRDGIAQMELRPGRYEIWTSRGPEYDVVREEVVVEAGRAPSLTHVLRRVVDTSGWIAADMHSHTVNSIDAEIGLHDRVLSAAAEGLDWLVATDHNFVTDLSQAVLETGLVDWLQTEVGIELTTLESGHFNSYPVTYERDQVARGAIGWARRPPDDLFAALRAMSPDDEDAIVQVNHPRDQIIGYFDQYDRDAYTAQRLRPGLFDRFISATGPAFLTEEGETTFSTDFELIEILNGKLFWQIHHHRIPLETPDDLLPRRTSQGDVFEGSDNQPEFPGAVDDWFNLLNLGLRPTGVGTSDSHNEAEEVGYFRTMIRVDETRPRTLETRTLTATLLRGEALATNGPMVEVRIADAGPGGTVVRADGTVPLEVRVQAAPWIGLDRLVVFRNAEVVHVEEIDPSRDLSASPLVETFALTLPILDEAAEGAERWGDAWFVVEVSGTRSMFPVVRPLELPPLLLTDAVGSLAGPLGLGGAEDSPLAPPMRFPITPVAITNPIFVQAAPGDFRPPGVPEARRRRTAEFDPGFRYGFAPGTQPLPMGKMLARWTGQERALRRAPWSVFSGSRGNPLDIRLALNMCRLH